MRKESIALWKMNVAWKKDTSCSLTHQLLSALSINREMIKAAYKHSSQEMVYA